MYCTHTSSHESNGSVFCAQDVRGTVAEGARLTGYALQAPVEQSVQLRHECPLRHTVCSSCTVESLPGKRAEQRKMSVSTFHAVIRPLCNCFIMMQHVKKHGAQDEALIIALNNRSRAGAMAKIDMLQAMRISDVHMISINRPRSHAHSFAGMLQKCHRLRVVYGTVWDTKVTRRLRESTCCAAQDQGM
jgi:hypothetical protein